MTDRTTIGALIADNKRLRQALEPFARIGRQLPDVVLDKDALSVMLGFNVEFVTTAEDFRRARTALEGE